MIAVEYSLSQRCFHKQTIEDMCKQNLESVMLRRQTDYIPIAICGSKEEADMVIDKIKDTIKNYSIYKDVEGNNVVPE